MAAASSSTSIGRSDKEVPDLGAGIPMDLHVVGLRRHGSPDLHDQGARRAQKIFRISSPSGEMRSPVQTRWLDAQNVLGFISWPFEFMIVLSGLVFYCYLYIPTGMQMAARYPAPPRVAVVGGGGPGTSWGRFASDAVGRVPGNIVAPGNLEPNVRSPVSLRRHRRRWAPSPAPRSTIPSATTRRWDSGSRARAPTPSPSHPTA